MQPLIPFTNMVCVGIKIRLNEGFKYKVLYSEKDDAVGGIEYGPGELAWRPVKTDGYYVIHCIFIIPKLYKQRGYGSLLVKASVDDAKTDKRHGIAVITRKGSWMAGRELFLKHDFIEVDRAPPDFELLALQFNKKNPTPLFPKDWNERLIPYEKGLTIFHSDQCPYATKTTQEICVTAENDYRLKPKMIAIKTARDAQASPCVFGTFCIVLNGKIVADHPISNTRFKNIMNKAFSD